MNFRRVQKRRIYCFLGRSYYRENRKYIEIDRSLILLTIVNIGISIVDVHITKECNYIAYIM